MKSKTITLVIIILLAVETIAGICFMNASTASRANAYRKSTSPKIMIPAPEDIILSSMTLEEKTGQMFMGCFYQGTPSPETIAQYHLGGAVLFRASFENTPPETLRMQLDAIDEANRINPIITVDEEGGTVARVSASPLYRSEPFQSPRTLFAAGGMDAVIADTHEKNQLLLQLGIDMNLAPVIDISQNPADYMYERSLGQNAKITSQYAVKTVAACKEDGIGCCLKHFPGYGSTADTHNGIAMDRRNPKQIKEVDMRPFSAGIKAGAHAVLVSHNIVASLDQELPASLSPAIHHILRDEMKFDGVIITDDLSMGAITQFSPDTDSAVDAIAAGNDILCTGYYANQFQAVLNAIHDGTISEKRINRSVRRILRLKLELGLIGMNDGE